MSHRHKWVTANGPCPDNKSGCAVYHPVEICEHCFAPKPPLKDKQIKKGK